VRREGNGPAPAQGLRPEPQILCTRTWNGSAYDERPEEIDECECEVCDDCDCRTCSECEWTERKRRLPDQPREAELVAAVTFWELDIGRLGSLEDRYDVPLAALKNLRAKEGEKLGHSFAVYGHRRGNSAERNSKRLLETFQAASGKYGRSIDPADRCGPL